MRHPLSGRAYYACYRLPLRRGKSHKFNSPRCPEEASFGLKIRIVPPGLDSSRSRFFFSPPPPSLSISFFLPLSLQSQNILSLKSNGISNLSKLAGISHAPVWKEFRLIYYAQLRLVFVEETGFPYLKTFVYNLSQQL